MKRRKAAVDKSGKDGIMDMRGGSMYRKHTEGKIEPMSKKQLNKIVKGFKKQGGVIQFDEATDKYLALKNAEAATYDAKTILLKQNPSRASVYEELIHATQYKNGENKGTRKSRIECEIAAQEKLLKHAKAYKLTDPEIAQTKRALKDYKDELREYLKDGGV